MSQGDLCIAGDRCCDYDHREDRPSYTEDGPLCEGDLYGSERAVTALVGDYAALEQQIPRPLSVWDDGQPGGSAESPLPLRVDVLALQERIHWVLTAWEEVVRERDRLSDSITRGVRAGWAVQAAATILRPRIRLLAKIGPVEMADYPGLDEQQLQRWMGVDHAELPGWWGALDFVDMHSLSQSLLGLTRAQPERCDGIPCPGCDLLALYREPGEDTIRCGGCDRRLPAAEYKRWTGLLAESVKARDVA